jgi:hypothetical protein
MSRLGRARRKPAGVFVGAAAPINPNDRWGFELFAELETPNAPAVSRDGRVFWAELEAPTASRLGRLVWAEIEIPVTSRKGELEWMELEAPLAPRTGRVSWAELGTGDVQGASGILINARLVHLGKPLRPHRRHPHLPNVFVPIEEERWNR